MSEMYRWRGMSTHEREAALRERKVGGRPWHSPPHFGVDKNFYLITAACYDHKSIMQSSDRLDEWERDLLSVFENAGADLRGWVILPNHWHVVASVSLSTLRPLLARLNNGKSTQWNREDQALGRKVWHGFADRYIRSEGHYYASLNYIHANPAKHGYAAKSADWRWSSLEGYLANVGRETLASWWKAYPVDEYGKGWDDF